MFSHPQSQHPTASLPCPLLCSVGLWLHHLHKCFGEIDFNIIKQNEIHFVQYMLPFIVLVLFLAADSWLYFTYSWQKVIKNVLWWRYMVCDTFKRHNGLASSCGKTHYSALYRLIGIALNHTCTSHFDSSLFLQLLLP